MTLFGISAELSDKVGVYKKCILVAFTFLHRQNFLF